jgi:ABC-type dipeptide/oligopeptide/nickel transport system permease component
LLDEERSIRQFLLAGFFPGQLVLFRHALRQAMFPVITVLGMDVTVQSDGIIFLENVVTLPGIVLLMVQSAFNFAATDSTTLPDFHAFAPD